MFDHHCGHDQGRDDGLNISNVRMLVMSCQEGDRLTRCGELKVTMQVEGLAPCGLVATVVSKPGW